MAERSTTAFDAQKDIGDHVDCMTIWIDAICIHQTNPTKKEMQIPLMTGIYTCAKKVYIHLGRWTKESDLAMDWIFKASRRWYRGIGLLGRGSGGGVESLG
jgi:hypothetical protein